MIKTILFAAANFLFLNSAIASWYCHEVASERNGNSINSCGIGNALTEDEARKNALSNAYKELEMICHSSSDCNKFELTINPLRTECSKKDSFYECHRGISATITNQERDLSLPRQFDTGSSFSVKKKIIQEEVVTTKRGIVEFTSSPESLIYVDGVELCTTPCSKELQYGEHQVEISKQDHERISKKISVNSKISKYDFELINLYGLLSLKNVPEDAEIRVDDLKISSHELKLVPGEHVVSIESKNSQPFHKSVTLAKGEIVNLDCTSEPLYGFVEVEVKNEDGNDLSSHVLVDGKNLGMSPDTFKMPAGTHQIIATQGDLERTEEITITANEKRKIDLILSSKPKSQQLTTWHIAIGPESNLNSPKDHKISYGLFIAVQKSLFKNRLGIQLSTSVGGHNWLDSGNSDSRETYSKSSIALPIYFDSFYVSPSYGIKHDVIPSKPTSHLSFYSLGVGCQIPQNNKPSFGTLFIEGGLSKYTGDLGVDPSIRAGFRWNFY